MKVKPKEHLTEDSYIMKLQISQFNSLASKFLKLWFLILLLQTQVLADNCTGDQITLVDKSKKFVQCAPCPPCGPGQEYTVPCHTTVSMDTVRTCINCPRGKFSRKFDTKPCADCRRCTKRHIKRVCTFFRNAKCGDCLAGYFYSDVVMGCVGCDRCCNDSKDERPLGCKTVGMCKPRLSGCPTTAAPSTSRIKEWLTKMLNKSKVHSTPNTSTFKASTRPFFTTQGTTPTSPQTTEPAQHQPEESTVATVPAVLARKNERQNKRDDNSKSIITVLSVVIGVISAILIVVGVAFVRLKQRERYSRSLSDTGSHYSTPVEHEPLRCPNDRTLKDFMENETDACGTVCEMLYKKTTGGMYDFDRIANKFSLPWSQRQAIQNVRNTPGENPTKELIDVLCRSMPEPITVKQFAHKVKEIKRHDVDQELEPFFQVQQTTTL